jgi:hypothetical protein
MDWSVGMGWSISHKDSDGARNLEARAVDAFIICIDGKLGQHNRSRQG